MSENKRRNFLKGALALSTVAFIPDSLKAADKNESLEFPVGTKILFQGDSITDGARSRDNDWNHVMGHGYAYIVASRLGFEFPERKYQFYNKGISGNTVADLLDRWQKDTLDLKPDLLSILVGVNDVNAEIDGKANFTDKFYADKYRNLLDVTRKNLPNTRLIIGEPFLLPVGRVKANWQTWSEKIKQRQQIAKTLADEYKAKFIPFQSHFDKATQKAPAEYWIWDGIHPMPAGHELMAREWIKAAK